MKRGRSPSPAPSPSRSPSSSPPPAKKRKDPNDDGDGLDAIPGHLAEGSEDVDTVEDSTKLWITVIDVGQGECTLIRYYAAGEDGDWKDEHVVLIDGGRAHFADDSIEPTLTALDVRRIDTVVCTHYDADHMEGLTALMEGHPEFFTAAKVYERSADARANDDKVTKFRTAFHGKLHTITPATVINVGTSEGHPTIRCLHVGTGSLWSDENDYSVALLVQFGRFSFYLGGDLTATYEDGLARAHVCAIKCGHHGSKHSSSPRFLQALAPRAAFISAGRHDYCHPDDETIQRLCADAAVDKIYLTNCVYNRGGINDDFATQENALLAQIWTEVEAWFVTHAVRIADPPVGFTQILALEGQARGDFDTLLGQAKLVIRTTDIRRKLPNDEGGRKAWRDLAALYLAAHDMQANLAARAGRTVKGVVAGDAHSLGNLDVIVTGSEAEKDCEFSVYFYDGSAMQRVFHTRTEDDPCRIENADRGDVHSVPRGHAAYNAPFLLGTGPSGADRANLTPDEVAELADAIDEMRSEIEKMEDTDDLNAVEAVIDGKSTPRASAEFTKFKAAYDAVVVQYSAVFDTYGDSYALKDPAAEANAALASAREAETPSEDDEAYSQD